MKHGLILFLTAISIQTFAGVHSESEFTEDPLPLFASEVSEFSCKDSGDFDFEIHYRHVRDKEQEGKLLYSTATLKRSKEQTTSYYAFDFFNSDRMSSPDGVAATIGLSILGSELIFEITKQGDPTSLFKMWLKIPNGEALNGKTSFQKARGLVHLGIVPYQVICTSRRAAN